jgi:hypothetical protein
MKLLDIPRGMLLDFHEFRMVDGVSQMILPKADLR